MPQCCLEQPWPWMGLLRLDSRPKAGTVVDGSDPGEDGAYVQALKTMLTRGWNRREPYGCRTLRIPSWWLPPLGTVACVRTGQRYAGPLRARHRQRR